MSTSIRLRSQWTTKYSEPDVHVPEEFEELSALSDTDDGTEVVYSPDGTNGEWIQIPDSLFVEPER